jgi:two-component sensor histidine kinase/CheY-like chemotaxis protein
MPGTTHLGSVGSFAVMQETMRGHSAPWLETELRVAELLRVALLEATVRRLASAAEARTQAANSKQQELLIAELNHRVRNILALIRALVSRSRESADTLENFVTGLDGRIQSLARAHDQLTDDRWGPVALRVVIENEFHAYLGDDGLGQARLSGPPILVQPEALTVLALVMHELATNSAKYGALSKRQGTVDVTWLLDADGALSIAWREIGGPPVSPPTRRGFGTTVIERIVPFQLQGRAVQRFEPDGLQADFIVPARFVKLGEDIAPQAPVATVPAPAISFCGTAMVLEDNALLALDAEEILLSLGFETVEVVGTAMAALDAVVRLDGNVAFALLDMNLGDHTSMVVAEALLDRGVPFAFATGNGKKLDLPPSLAAVAAIVLKPYRKQDIAGLVGRTMSAH